MEIGIYSIIKNMETFPLILFLSISNLCISQDTLREKDSFMYSRYYVLDDDGTFEFRFNHCTGTAISYGTYEMTKNKIRFNYNHITDSLVQKTDSIDLYSYSESGIKKMKRYNQNYFIHSIIVTDENQEEPWKKGTKRKVEFVYELK